MSVLIKEISNIITSNNNTINENIVGINYLEKLKYLLIDNLKNRKYRFSIKNLVSDLEKENSELKTLLAEQLLKTKALEIALGKPLLSPDRQRSMAAKVQRALSCSRRAVCRWLGLGLCLGLHPTRRKVTHLQLDR